MPKRRMHVRKARARHSPRIERGRQCAPAGVGIGPGEPECGVTVGQAVQCSQQRGKLALALAWLKRDGVKSDQQVAPRQGRTQCGPECRTIQQWQAPQVVQPRVADHEYLPRVLAHLAQAPRRQLVRGEVQVCHLADGMADRLVESAFGGVAAGNMGQRDVVHQAGLGCSQDLEAIAQHQHHIGLQLGQRIGHADHAQADGLGHPRRGVAGQKHFDPAADLKTVALNLAHRQAELGRQVHAGHDQLQFDARRRPQVVQHPVQQAVFGTAAGDHRDLLVQFAQAGLGINCGLLGRLTMRCAKSVATGMSMVGQVVYIGRRVSNSHTGRVICAAWLVCVNTASR